MSHFGYPVYKKILKLEKRPEVDKEDLSFFQRLNENRDRQIQNLEKLAGTYEQRFAETNNEKFLELSLEKREQINALYDEQNKRLQEERHKAKRVRL